MAFDGRLVQHSVQVLLLGTWFTTRREYTVATFVDAGVAPGSAVAYYAAEELVREQIREALETWDDACTPASPASRPT